MTLSPVRGMFSALSDSEGYHTCYPPDSAGADPDLREGGRILLQILNLPMMQNGKGYREARPQQES